MKIIIVINAVLDAEYFPSSICGLYYEFNYVPPKSVV